MNDTALLTTMVSGLKLSAEATTQCVALLMTKVVPAPSGISAQVRAAHVAVARNQTEWQSLWRSWIGTDPPHGLPAGGQSVAVFVGPKHTGGHRVEVGGIEQRTCLDVVKFAEHMPAPGTFVTQAFTNALDRGAGAGERSPRRLRAPSSTADARLLLPTPEGPRRMQMSEICPKDRRL